MKFDFHNDKRLMQAAGGSTGVNLDEATIQGFKQRRNALNQAVKAGDAEKVRAAQDELNRFTISKNLIEAGSEASKKLVAVSGELEATRANQTVAMGQAAGQADIQLQTQRGQTVIGAENTEATGIFNSQLSVATGLRGAYTGLKTMEMYICAACKAFGIELNTKGFDTWLDDFAGKMIKDPSIKTSDIANADTSISSRAAEGNVNSSAMRAQDTLRDASPSQLAGVYDAIEAKLNGGSNPAGPKADLPTQQDIMKKANDLVKDGTIADAATARNIVSSWSAAARNSGDKATVDTAQDQALVGSAIDRMIRDAAKAHEVRQSFGLPDAAPKALAIAGPTAPAPK